MIIPWMSAALWSDFLDYRFSIPARLVDTGPLAFTIIGTSVLYGLAVMIDCLGLLGWLHYWDRFGPASTNAVVGLVLITVLSMLTTFQIALNQADQAAISVQQEAKRLLRPSPVAATVQFERVCVKPVDPAAGIDGGPLPTDHPVLTIRTTDDRVWLWDPVTNDGPPARSVSAPRAAVTTTFAANGQESCPSATG